MKLLLLLSFFYLSENVVSDKKTKITIIHINDFHAHYEEMSPSSADCKEKDKCIGGYARIVHMVKYLQEKYKDEHPLYLNAGDNFQGTPWYTMFTWNVTKHFLNLLPADVITLGNHEFDHGVDGLLPFINSINSRLLVGNIDDESKDFLQRYSKDKIKGRTIINKDGIRIGIIGVIIKNVNELSNTGNITFLDESVMVKRHARLLAKQNVNIIIVLSHCGIEIDRKIAKYGGPLIDVIVGGHSHTYLYNGSDPNNPPDTPADKYPVVVTQDDGHKVLVVQAGSYGKYVGVLKVKFDMDGDALSWEGNPIYLSHDVKKDEEIVRELKPWKKAVDKKGRQSIGQAKVLIDHSKCKKSECNAGNLITDVMVDFYKNRSVSIAIHNGGGIRSSIDAGRIIYNHMLTMIPFGSTFDLVKIPGNTIREMFEHAVDIEITGNDMYFRNLLQVSGFKVTYNLKKPVKKRVEMIQVLEGNDTGYQLLDDKKFYYVVVNSFLYRGGDGYTIIKRDQKEHIIGPLDLDTTINYIKEKKVIEPKLEDRIIMKY